MAKSSKVSEYHSLDLEPKVETTKIVSLRDAKVYVTGRYSRQEYLFDGAGSTLDIDNKDVEWILSLRQPSACCGGGGGGALFELAKE